MSRTTKQSTKLSVTFEVLKALLLGPYGTWHHVVWSTVTIVSEDSAAFVLCTEFVYPESWYKLPDYAILLFAIPQPWKNNAIEWSVRTGPGARPASFWMGAEGYFTGGEAATAPCLHTYLCISAEFKNDWSYAITRLYAFSACMGNILLYFVINSEKMIRK